MPSTSSFGPTSQEPAWRRSRTPASPTATSCATRSAPSPTASSRSARWNPSSLRGSSTPRTNACGWTTWWTASRRFASRPRTLPEALELHEVDGAFERVEAWLRAHGFFAAGNEALEADLYLGYGLAEAIRRERTPPPEEPCPLPLVACSIRESAAPGGAAGYRIGDWRRTWAEAEHAAAVDEVQRAIARGDVYQVNLVQHLAAPFAGDAAAVAAR